MGVTREPFGDKDLQPTRRSRPMFIDKDGDIFAKDGDIAGPDPRGRMVRGGEKKGKPEKTFNDPPPDDRPKQPPRKKDRFDDIIEEMD